MGLANPLVAGAPEADLAENDQVNYKAEFKRLKPLAEGGDARSQNLIGFLFEKGLGVSQDYPAAAKWYRKAAEQGIADAQYKIGSMYVSGHGVSQDYAEAAKWLTRAANQGDLNAQFNIGSMYGRGQGVPQSHTEAAKWFRKAADQGNAPAQFIMGLMYRQGEGVRKDNDQAANWYRKAAHQDLAQAQFNLGSMYLKGTGMPQNAMSAYFWFSLAARHQIDDAADILTKLARNITPAQIAEAEIMVRSWRPMDHERIALGKGLDIQNVKSERKVESGIDVLKIAGSIENVSDHPLEVPLIKVVFYDCFDKEIGHHIGIPHLSKLEPGESIKFKERVKNLPSSARRMEVTYAEEMEPQNQDKTRTPHGTSLEILGFQLRNLACNMQADSVVKVASDDKDVVITMASVAIYQPRSEKFRKIAIPVLAEIGKTLALPRYQNYFMEIEGHTDDFSILTPPSKLELSEGRAASMMHFLIEQGIDGKRVKSIGYGDSHPKVPHRDAKGDLIRGNSIINQRVIVRVFSPGK